MENCTEKFRQPVLLYAADGFEFGAIIAKPVIPEKMANRKVAD